MSIFHIGMPVNDDVEKEVRSFEEEDEKTKAQVSIFPTFYEQIFVPNIV